MADGPRRAGWARPDRGGGVDRVDQEDPLSDGPAMALRDGRAWLVAALVAAIALVRRLRR